MLNYTLSYSLSPKTGKCLFSNRNLNAATFFTLLHWSSSNVIILQCSCRNEFYRETRTRNPLAPWKRWVSSGSWLPSPASRFMLAIASFFALPTLWKHQSLCWILIFVLCQVWLEPSMEQAKAVSEAEPAPAPALLSDQSLWGFQ